MKNLIRSVCLFLLVALVQPGNASAGEKMIEVKITNLSAKVVLTPPIVAASKGQITVFQLTETATVALEMLAKYCGLPILKVTGTKRTSKFSFPNSAPQGHFYLNSQRKDMLLFQIIQFIEFFNLPSNHLFLKST